jgi:4-amino-4-deoxy-L-arabinose transferase-like glycosyltransferase
LAGLYNALNPIFEAPDELGHYSYVRSLALGSGLPIDTPDRPNQPGQPEGAQPPLYYAVAALLTFWAPHGDLAVQARNNPAGSIGDPRTPGNKNHFLHGPDQAFPWSGETLNVHLTRFSTTLWGVVTVILTYGIGRLVFARPIFAVAAAMVVAGNPQFLFMSSAVNNDVAVAAVAALLIWLCLRSARRPPSRRAAVLLGVVAGLAVLAKPLAIGGVLFAVAATAIATRRAHRGIPTFAARALEVIVAFTFTSGWWFAYNVVTYHSAMPVDSFVHRSQIFDQAPSLARAASELGGLLMSYWAVFGWFSILGPAWYYEIFDALMLLGALGLGVAALRWIARRPRRDADRTGVAFTVAWCILIFGALCAYRLVVEAFQGRLLFAAMSANAILLVVGWYELAPRRNAGLVAGALGLSLIGPAASAPLTMLIPAYRPPAIVEATAVNPTSPSYARFGNAIRLIGADLNPPAGTRLRPGDPIQVTLYWQGLRAIDRDYELSLQLIEASQRKLAALDTMPGSGSAPTSNWPTNRVIVDPYVLHVDSRAAGPTLGQLVLVLYQPDTLETLPVFDQAGAQIPSQLAIGRYVLAGPSDLARVQSGQPFGDQISLIDYQVDRATLHPGDELHGFLLLGGLAHMQQNYTVFVHLEGPQGLVANDDGQPMHGAYPTAVWAPGDLVQHAFGFRVPITTPAGRYSLRAGFYDLGTGQRLTSPAGDAATLTGIQVEQ